MKFIKILLIICLMLPNLTFAGSLQQEAYKVAEKDCKLPVIEITNNNDHWRIDEYCRNVGIPLHSPYCAAATYTWYKDAASNLGVKNPLYRTGSSGAIYRNALANPMRFKFIKARLVKLGSERLQLGDIALYSEDVNFIHGHTEFVVKELSNTTHYDIGANTTGNNITSEQREQTRKSKGKGGVYQKKRTISDSPKFRTVGFVRIR